MAAMDINRHLQRKFLIVVDGTPESHAALRFAAFILASLIALRSLSISV